MLLIKLLFNGNLNGGWIKKGGATPDGCRTPARGSLFGPNLLPQVKSEKRNKTEK
jgi:hypothetical protein